MWLLSIYGTLISGSTEEWIIFSTINPHNQDIMTSLALYQLNHSTWTIETESFNIIFKVKEALNFVDVVIG